MRRLSFGTGLLLVSLFLMAGCGGGGGDNAAVPPPPTPTPAQSAAGSWNGQSVTAVAADVFTSFEFNASGPFSVGSTPYTATFSNGNAESRGIPSFYISGLNSWHVLVGTSATVSFETSPNTLSFHVRMEAASDVGQIQVFDENNAAIQTIVLTNVFQTVTVTRTAGQTLIDSVSVTSTSGGDVVIDDLTFGYDGAGFAGATDDIGCLVSENLEFACVLTDSITDAFVGGARGTLQVTNNNQISGSGTVYAAPGEVLANGKTFADLSIASGLVSTATSLDLIVDAAGATSIVATDFDTDYNRGSSLAAVAAVYSSFDIFGDPSSLTIDAGGVLDGQSAASCSLAGQVSIIDAMFNAYDLQIDVTSCGGLNGTYDGLGLTDDTSVTDDTFVFGVFTDQTSIFGVAVK